MSLRSRTNHAEELNFINGIFEYFSNLQVPEQSYLNVSYLFGKVVVVVVTYIFAQQFDHSGLYNNSETHKTFFCVNSPYFRSGRKRDLPRFLSLTSSL
jgi:hypothetical protein